MFGRSIYVPENAALTGGSPQTVHEQLWAEGQRRRLQVRGALAGLGLVIGVWLGGIGFGLLTAAAAATVHALYHWHQRMASSVWRKGQRGERRTALVLRLALSQGGYRILHGRKTPDHGQLDHVVVGPTGVIVIDNQAISPETDIAGYQGRLFIDERSGKKLSTPLREKADATAALLAERLGGEIAVEAVGVIHGGTLRRGVVEADGVTLVRAHRLPGWIRSQRNRYTPEQVAEIADAAHRLPISRQAIIVR